MKKLNPQTYNIVTILTVMYKFEGSIFTIESLRV